MKFTLTCFLLLLLVGCGKRQPSQQCPVLDFESSIARTTGNRADFTLNTLAEAIEVVPIQTLENCLMAQPRICWAADTILILKDRGNIYQLNSTTGEIRTKIAKQGKGPGEYLMVGDVVCDPLSGKIYVCDLAHKMNTYDMDGRFLSSVSLDFVGGFNQLPDGNFVITYYPSAERTQCVGIYDSLWHPIAGFISVRDQSQQNLNGFISVETINRYNNDCYYKSALGDTLYHISSSNLTPILVLNQGSLRLPAEIANDVSRKRERAKHLFGEYGYLSENYYFTSYYYNNRKYYDIWDIYTATLIYRNVQGSPDEPEGVELTVDGKRVRIWPKYIADETLYGIVEPESEIVSGLSEDSNPILVKVKLRS